MDKFHSLPNVKNVLRDQALITLFQARGNSMKPYVLATDLEASDIITAGVSEASEIMTASVSEVSEIMTAIVSEASEIMTAIVSEASEIMTASVSEASDIMTAGVSSSPCMRMRHLNTIMVTSFTNGKMNEVHI